MLDVKVKIDLFNPVGSLDWGYPLILSKGDTNIEYAECTSIDEVLAAGFDSKSAEYKAAEAMFKQNNPPAKIAVCAFTDVTAENLATITNKGWRQLVTVGGIDTKTVAGYVGATKDKMYFAGVSSIAELQALMASETIEVADGKTETKESAAISNRVVVIAHKTSATTAAAAVAAAVAGKEVGSITYKNLTLNGVDAAGFTETEIGEIHECHGITVVEKIGYIVTSEGYATNGEYADITDCTDYIVSQIEYQTQQALIANNKLPYDNRGISVLENIAYDVLKTAHGNGMIAEDIEGNALFSVSYASRSEVSASDISARKYTGGKFAFTLGGAIHNVDVNGEISVV